MNPVFPDNGGGAQQWPSAPGGAATPVAWQPPQPGQPSPGAAYGGAGGASQPMDYNVNLGGAAGGQMQFDPNSMPMPFDPTQADPNAGQMHGQMGGQMGGQIGGQMGGAAGSNAWAHAPASGPAGSWGPASVDAFASNPLAGLAMKGANDFINAQSSRFLSPARIGRLKYYFAVNNSYVLQKLKDWKRQIESPNSPGQIDIGGGGNGGALHGHGVEPVYLPPRADVNAPDLYIPAMAFFTFALLMGYVMGTAGKFNPEALLGVCSFTFVTLVLEVLLMTLGFYMVDSGSPKTLDLIAWSGYKYVGLIVALLTGIAAGPWAFWLMKILMGGASGLFLMCTLHRALTPAVEASHGGQVPTSPKRNYFLVLIGVVQIVIAWWLLRTVTLPTAQAVVAPLMGAGLGGAAAAPGSAAAAAGLGAAAVNAAGAAL